MAKIAILSALPQELAEISRAAHVHETDRIGGAEFVTAELDGVSVVLALSGIGKVNAAFAATVMLDRYGCRGVIFSGVAGSLSPDLDLGDVLIAQRLVQHDYGARVDEAFWPAEPGALPTGDAASRHGGYALPDVLARELERLAAEVRLPRFTRSDGARQPSVRLGTVLTGDTFLNCGKTRQALRELHAGDAVEMEGAAVAQVAARFDVPCIAIRTISDAASDGSHTSFAELVEIAAANSAILTRRLLPVLARTLSPKRGLT